MTKGVSSAAALAPPTKLPKDDSDEPPAAIPAAVASADLDLDPDLALACRGMAARNVCRKKAVRRLHDQFSIMIICINKVQVGACTACQRSLGFLTTP